MDFSSSNPPSALPAGQLAQIACILEATARKPGNVHRFLDFDDAHYLDYLLSATAIAEPLNQAEKFGVGRTVLRAVEATRRVVSTNTNLGMILLLAPLSSIPLASDWSERLPLVLEGLTVNDARHVYQAIRLAKPGGLGSASDQDVKDEPTVTLLHAMQLAADRDLIARQYASEYKEVRDIALPALRTALEADRPLETSIIKAHLALLSETLDTLILRKRGPEVAAEASRRAALVLASGWPDAQPNPLPEFDAWLRADDHARNPGATADLVCAALFLALRDGTIALPRPVPIGF